MSYKTELMEQILTSAEANTIVQYLSPIYGEAYTGLWLLQVIGAQLDDMHDWTVEYVDQVTPQTATWAIGFWEKEYGITPDASWTLEQRRANLVSKIRFRAPMNPATLSDIASGISGVPVEIIENTGQNEFEVLVHRWTDKFDRAEEAINEAKPSHLIFTIRMSLLVDAAISSYQGIATSRMKKINVTIANL